MYIEDKTDGLVGPARIGRVTYSKTGKTLVYGGREFQSQKGRGAKSNYFELGTGRVYWISGPRKDGKYGRDADANYHIVLTQAMLDLKAAYRL